MTVRGLPRMICGCRWHTELSAAHLCSSTLSLETEEQRTRPSGSGDQPSNDRKALVALALVLKALLGHGHVMCLSVPLAKEAGAGLDALRFPESPFIHIWVTSIVVGDLFKLASDLGRQAAVSLLLKLVGKYRHKELLANIWWGWLLQTLSPLRPQLGNLHLREPSDLLV